MKKLSTEEQRRRAEENKVWRQEFLERLKDRIVTRPYRYRLVSAEGELYIAVSVKTEGQEESVPDSRTTNAIEWAHSKGIICRKLLGKKNRGIRFLKELNPLLVETWAFPSLIWTWKPYVPTHPGEGAADDTVDAFKARKAMRDALYREEAG